MGGIMFVGMGVVGGKLALDNRNRMALGRSDHIGRCRILHLLRNSYCTEHRIRPTAFLVR